MEFNFKTMAALVLAITVSVALGIILADTWMYKKELKRQQKLQNNGQRP